MSFYTPGFMPGAINQLAVRLYQKAWRPTDRERIIKDRREIERSETFNFISRFPSFARSAFSRGLLDCEEARTVEGCDILGFFGGNDVFLVLGGQYFSPKRRSAD